MRTIYFATATAIFITASLAANLLLIGITASPVPELLARLSLRARLLGRRLKRFIDTQVAEMIARREHQAITYAAGRTAGCEGVSHADIGRRR
jgi:hypothetical protein